MLWKLRARGTIASNTMSRNKIKFLRLRTRLRLLDEGNVSIKSTVHDQLRKIKLMLCAVCSSCLQIRPDKFQGINGWTNYLLFIQKWKFVREKWNSKLWQHLQDHFDMHEVAGSAPVNIMLSLSLYKESANY